MSDVYLATMRLNCFPQTKPSLVEFDARWTTPIQRDWSGLAFDGTMTDTELADRLNKTIFGAYAAQIEKDLGLAPGSAVGVQTFTPTVWSPGTSGFHEATATIMVEVAGMAPQPWTLPSGGSKPVVPTYMSASASWKRVSVTT